MEKVFQVGPQASDLKPTPNLLLTPQKGNPGPFGKLT